MSTSRKQVQKTRLSSLEIPLVSIGEIKIQKVGTGLKKPVDTLAMAPEEGGRISLIERKLYFTLMWFAQKEGWCIGQECFKASLIQVLQKMHYNSKNMVVIREALVSMVTTRVEWQSPTKTESSNWGVSGMIAHAEICSNREGNTIEWSYSPKIRSNILDPFPYARGSLEVQDVLRSYSALALYDICSRYLTSSTGLTPRRHWLWWRPVLTGGSDGLDTDPQFKVFNRDVLKKAMVEINMHTPIDVRLILYKEGQRVNEIQFHATRKKDYKIPLKNVNTASGLKEIGRAIAAGISQKQAELFFEEHGENILSKGINVLEERQDKKSLPPIKEPKAYLKKVLDNQPYDAATGALVDTHRENALEKHKRLQLIEQFRAYKLEESWALFNESNENEKASLNEQFKHEVVSKAQASTQNLYREKGLQAVYLRSLMRNFLAVHFFGEYWNKPSDEELFRFTLIHINI